MFEAIGVLLPFLSDLVQRVIPDPVQRDRAQREITKALTERDSALYTAMAEVMKADAQSDSWVTRSMRPIVVLWGLFMVSFVGVIAPAAGIQSEVVSGLAGIPGELWTLVTVPVGIWMAGRTVEKGITSMANASMGNKN